MFDMIRSRLTWMTFDEDDDDRNPEGWNPDPGDRSARKRPRPLVILFSILGVSLLLHLDGSPITGAYEIAHRISWRIH